MNLVFFAIRTSNRQMKLCLARQPALVNKLPYAPPLFAAENIANAAFTTPYIVTIN